MQKWQGKRAPVDFSATLLIAITTNVNVRVAFAHVPAAAAQRTPDLPFVTQRTRELGGRTPCPVPQRTDARECVIGDGLAARGCVLRMHGLHVLIAFFL